MRRAVIATPTSEPLLPRLAGIVGQAHVITDEERMAPHLSEWRKLYTGRAQALVKPASTDEVSAIMRLAHMTGTPVVPQSGNTGGVGGQIPDGSGRAILLSLSRMNRIRDMQPLSNMATVEAGVILQNLQEAARAAGRFFPLSLPSEGSCMVGGNLASNAGGTGVIAYGNMRDLVLGLEVVLPDGRVMSGLSGLRKDNAGYDLKHLFIGSEGTLGVITAATLKLFQEPRQQVTAFVGLQDPELALRLLARAQRDGGGLVAAFELIPRLGVEMSMAFVQGLRDPLAEPHPWYALIEVSAQTETGLADSVEAMLADAIEAGEVTDATVASS
ncbi:MAG: FAD-binding oxidoreductase, partial [Beijerinckiaceae bacterium]